MRRLMMVLLLCGLSACGAPYSYQVMRAIDSPQTAPDFTLTNQDGQPFQLSGQSGKVKLLFFGFTSCPDICPTTLSDMKYVQEKLGQLADKTEIVFITVDPERDSASQMKRYLSIYSARFIGLRADDPAQLATIMGDYGAYAKRQELPGSGLGYTMDHTASVYVIDTQGRWFGMISHGDDPDLIAEDLRHLIND